MTLWLSLLVVAAVSLVLTRAMRHFALACSFADLPNARISQPILTCPEGGVAIAFGARFVLSIFCLVGLMAWTLVLVVLGSGTGRVKALLVDGQGRIADRRWFPWHITVGVWALLRPDEQPSVVSGLDDFRFGVMKGDQGLWIK